ncbi:MAG: hypothetical protein RMK29_12350 [Myxococcales bacterium]|nr:hypothetical protein [Myxococcales bacterium]
MSKPDAEDGTDRTALHPARIDQDPPCTPGDVASSLEEPTLQGASYLVERITPVPAPHLRPVAPDPGGPAPLPHGESLSESPTAAVQNPGPRPSPSTWPQAGVAASAQPGLLIRPMDVPPDVDTAYVPLPGQPGPPPERSSTRDTVIAPSIRAGPLGQVAERVRKSRNARLLIIIGAGLLSLSLTVFLFLPRPPPPVPVPVVEADPGPAVPPPQAPPEPQQPPDPARIEERDQLLERAILAVESGRLEEALALFRRYMEEDPSPAAEFMVQLLQMQLSHTGKEP